MIAWVLRMRGTEGFEVTIKDIEVEEAFAAFAGVEFVSTSSCMVK